MFDEITNEIYPLMGLIYEGGTNYFADFVNEREKRDRRRNI